MEQQEIIRRIKSGISAKDPKAEIYLYGSRARGDNRQDSDWDILVITPQNKITFDYEYNLRDPIIDLELDSGQVISVLVYSKSDWTTKMPHTPLFLNIKREGIKI
jgi:uncharacterized protein